MIVIDLTRFWLEESLFEWEDGQTHLQEHIKHEPADLSDSRAKKDYPAV